MEDLAPSYQFVLLLSEDFRAGKTLRTSLQSFLAAHRDDFSKKVLDWLVHWEKGELEPFYCALEKSNSSIYQRVLFDLLRLHVQGASILDPLEALELEMRQASRLQLEQHLGELPFKLLIPLLLFQFPALLILIIGPLVFHLIKEVQ